MKNAIWTPLSPFNQVSGWYLNVTNEYLWMNKCNANCKSEATSSAKWMIKEGFRIIVKDFGCLTNIKVLCQIYQVSDRIKKLTKNSKYFLRVVIRGNQLRDWSLQFYGQRVEQLEHVDNELIRQGLVTRFSSFLSEIHMSAREWSV